MRFPLLIAAVVMAVGFCMRGNDTTLHSKPSYKTGPAVIYEGPYTRRSSSLMVSESSNSRNSRRRNNYWISNGSGSASAVRRGVMSGRRSGFRTCTPRSR